MLSPILFFFYIDHNMVFTSISGATNVERADSGVIQIAVLLYHPSYEISHIHLCTIAVLGEVLFSYAIFASVEHLSFFYSC